MLPTKVNSKTPAEARRIVVLILMDIGLRV
jgi:hypothetical protein